VRLRVKDKPTAKSVRSVWARQCYFTRASLYAKLVSSKTCNTRQDFFLKTHSKSIKIVTYSYVFLVVSAPFVW
jgi:hypothetical protein